MVPVIANGGGAGCLELLVVSQSPPVGWESQRLVRYRASRIRRPGRLTNLRQEFGVKTFGALNDLLGHAHRRGVERIPDELPESCRQRVEVALKLADGVSHAIQARILDGVALEVRLFVESRGRMISEAA